MRRIRLQLAVFLTLVMVSWYAPGAWASFTSSAVIEVESGGSDTTGVGVFDPGVSGMDGTASVASANTAAPVVTVTGEASGDLNAWFYLKSGTNSIPGWYQITAVDTVNHKYTINAAIGSAVLANGTRSTAVGCASSGSSLTSQTWAVDFTQTTGNITTGTASSSGTTLTATTGIFRKPMVGNGVTNGSAWKVITAFTSSTVVTVDSAPTWTTQSISVGGALASPGQASAIQNGSKVWLKGNGTYSIGTGTVNTAGNRVDWTGNNQTWLGYTTIRGDGGYATMQASGAVSTFMFGASSARSGCVCAYLICDGNSQTSVTGFNLAGATRAHHLKALNCPGTGIGGPTGPVELCFASACGTGISTSAEFSVAQACTTAGFGSNTNIGGFKFCIADRCQVGFTSNSGNVIPLVNNVAYKSISHGFVINTSGGGVCANNISYGNGTGGSGKGFSGTIDPTCFYNNYTGSNNQTDDMTTGLTSLGANPFISPDAAAASRNFGLNRMSNGGGLCQAGASPGAFIGIATTSYQAAGAVTSNRGPLRVGR